MSVRARVSAAIGLAAAGVLLLVPAWLMSALGGDVAVAVFGAMAALLAYSWPRRSPWRALLGVDLLPGVVVLRRVFGSPVLLPRDDVRFLRLRHGPPARATWLGDAFDPGFYGPGAPAEGDALEVEIATSTAAYRLVGVDAEAIADALGIGDRSVDDDVRPTWARAPFDVAGRATRWTALLAAVTAGDVHPSVGVAGRPLAEHEEPALRRRLDPWSAASGRDARDVLSGVVIGEVGLVLWFFYGDWWWGATAILGALAAVVGCVQGVHRAISALDAAARHTEITARVRRLGIWTLRRLANVALILGTAAGVVFGLPHALVPADVAAFAANPPSDPRAYGDAADALLARWSGPLVGPFLLMYLDAYPHHVNESTFEAAARRWPNNGLVLSHCASGSGPPELVLACAEAQLHPPWWRFSLVPAWYAWSDAYRARFDAGDEAGAEAAMRVLLERYPSAAVYPWVSRHPDFDVEAFVPLFPGSEPEARAALRVMCRPGRVRRSGRSDCP